MQYRYEKKFDTSYSTIDRTGRLGLVELMNINQDMCTEFFGSIKSDNKILREKNNAAWLYTRTKVKTGELPFWNTKTHAVTFISNISPIRIEIETDMHDDRNNLVFAAKTELCAIDFTERKLRKIGYQKIDDVLKLEKQNTYQEIEQDIQDAKQKVKKL